MGEQGLAPLRGSQQELRFGDPCRAKCSAPARSLGGGLCLFVSAMDNDLAIDAIGGAKDWEWDAPLPTLRECSAADTGIVYARIREQRGSSSPE